MKATVFWDVTQYSVVIGTDFSGGQHVTPNCCYISAKICGVTYKETVVYVEVAENTSVCLTTTVAYVVMNGELI
jgi:hypothetical protein